MVVKGVASGGMLVEAPQRESSMSFWSRAEIVVCDHPGHAAVGHYFHRFSHQVAKLDCQGDALVVVYRSAVL